MRTECWPRCAVAEGSSETRAPALSRDCELGSRAGPAESDGLLVHSDDSRHRDPTMSSKPSSKSAARKSTPPKASKSGAKKTSATRPAQPRHEPKTPPALPASKRDRESTTRPRISPMKSAAAPASSSELSSEVMEFITAIDAYKRHSRRPFPNWSEVFEVVKSLGYHRSA